MDVSFYDASDDSLIGTDAGVSSGGTASTTWSDLEYETTYSWYAIADDGQDTTQSHVWDFTTESVPEPDLDAEGDLQWVDVKPESTVSGTITVENIGDLGSLLDWEITEYPDWGTWSFDPEEGTDLGPGSTISIDVEVVAPPDKKTEFTGTVKIVNSADSSDYIEISVSLVTPRTRNNVELFIVSFFKQLFERFPLLEPMFIHLVSI